MTTIKIPEAASEIIRVLQEHGYEAYVVGGCVRDTLLGRTPGDWDITTSALPNEVKQLFHRTIDTGIQHGTVTVMVEKEGYEITTYRVDGIYEDGRHPKEVSFTPSLREDLQRRDFTINAMAYNHEQGIVDIFGGQEDLQAGIIRCVGSPTERFGEDALRMMRAVRFAAQLGFIIEENTFHAIGELAANLELVSAERIQVELSKLLLSAHPDFFWLLYQSGISQVILPEFDACVGIAQNSYYHQFTVAQHIITVLKSTPAILHLRLAALFHDMGKPEAKTTDENGIDHFQIHAKVSAQIAKRVLKRLKYDNTTSNKVIHLVEWHDYFLEPQKKMIRRTINKVGEENFSDLLLLMRSDAMGKKDVLIEPALKKLDEVEAIYKEILKAQECLSLKDLAINGKDLIAAGIKPGKEIGEILSALLNKVLEDPSLNNKEELLMQALLLK